MEAVYVHDCLSPFAHHCTAPPARRVYDMEAVYVHDAAALAAVVDPSLFDWEQGGGVLVVTDGPAKGRTIRDEGGQAGGPPMGPGRRVGQRGMRAGGGCLGWGLLRVGRRGIRAGGGCCRWRQRAAETP